MNVLICLRARILASVLADQLRAAGDEVVTTSSVRSANRAIPHCEPDVLIVDGSTGLGLRADNLDVPLIMLSDGSRPILSTAAPSPIIVPRTATLPTIITAVHALGTTKRSAARRPERADRIRAANASGHLAQFLSVREREVLSHLVLGASTATLAARLGISGGTARHHIQNIMTKLDAHTRLELVSIAVRDGLIDPTTGVWLEAVS